MIRVTGLRNPKIGTSENRWIYCDGSDWVMGFLSGELWLAHQLTAEPVFAQAARARRSQFRSVLDDRRAMDHDLGFIFSLHSVAEWLSTGEPLHGETHQGFANDSCWARGQAWLIHGFANCYRVTGNQVSLDAARRVASKAESLLGEGKVPVWDYDLPADGTQPIDSSAAAITAAGVMMLADLVPTDEALRWRSFGYRLLHGLLSECDLTTTSGAHGFLAHGAGHVPAGRSDTMLPYGDYYFMEALMRAEGHRDFFW